MSPIKGASYIRRLPQLGKIRLGIEVEEPKKNPYPQANRGSTFLSGETYMAFTGQSRSQKRHS